MQLTFVFFIYLNAWFVTLFGVVPFFIHEAKAEGVEYAAAPKPVRWRRALIINSLVSGAITAILVFIISSGMLSSLKYWE